MIKDSIFNDFDFYFKGIVTSKQQLRNFLIEVNQIKESIKSLSWEDLLLIEEKQSGNSKSYKIKFPTQIEEKIKILLTNTEGFFFDQIVRDELFQDESLGFYGCIFQLSILDNRIHIPGDGLSRGFRKLGLGPKMYRKIIELEKFVSSNDHNLSQFGKLLWNSLRNNEMFYTFYNERNAFAFASDYDPKKIIETLEKVINFTFYDKVLLDEDFVSNYKHLLQESNLKKYI